MERFVKGEIVVTPFPFSDLTSSTKRPALVIATLKGDNILLCQITTKERPDPYKLNLTIHDFETGGLSQNSFIMPSILFSIRNSVILYKSGKLKKQKIEEVQNKIINIIKS